MIIIIMCGLFVCSFHCIRSSVCFFFLDRFTSSSPYVALLLLLSQIYFFIVLGSNALTVHLVSFKKGENDRSFVLPVFKFGKNINKMKWKQTLCLCVENLPMEKNRKQNFLWNLMFVKKEAQLFRIRESYNFN